MIYVLNFLIILAFLLDIERAFIYRHDKDPSVALFVLLPAQSA